MSLPTIGVVIATPGRASIYRTLRSILYQGLIPGDDILVVGDGFHQPTKDLVDAFGPPFRYIATKPTRDWGHSQMNFGLKRVAGDVVIYQDDDDIFLPRVFEEIRHLVLEHPGAPIIGRVKTPHWGLLWSEPGLATLLDGHCLVAPNIKSKLGYMTPDYIGDQCYISTTIEHYANVNWVDRVWTLTRPTWKLFPRRVGPADVGGVYADNFLREMEERLPSIRSRLFEGPNDWLWFFYGSGPDALSKPVAAVKMFEEDGRTWATMSFVSSEDQDQIIDEVVEFASWAGQGQDVWFGTYADDEEIIAALKRKGYEDHARGKKVADFVMSWPPKWFPFETAREITDRGVHVRDWRDKWGP